MNEVIEIESIPTKIKYKGIIWVPELKNSQRITKVCQKEIKTKDNINKSNNVNKIDKVDKNFTAQTEKMKRGSLKKPYIIKWIEKLEVGSVFTLDQFYYKFPKHKKDTACRKRVDKIIVNMVLEGKINHWKREGQFRVLK